MKRILLAATLMIFCSGSLLAASGGIAAPSKSTAVEVQSDQSQISAPSGLLGLLHSWLCDLLGLDNDNVVDDDDSDDGPVFDDGSSGNSGHRAVAIRADNGWEDQNLLKRWLCI